MCTLLLDLSADGRRLVVGANRDERYARASAAPASLDGEPLVYAGRDLEAGGSWLAVRDAPPRRLVALLNRPLADGAIASRPEGRRSRGHLCLDAARAPDWQSAIEAARAATAHSMPFNLLVVERGAAHVLHFDGHGPVVHEVPPGIHALTHGELDAADPRTRLARERFAAAVATADPATRADARAAFPPLVATLRRHDEPGAPCRHEDEGGTVSASLIAIDLDGGDACWLYAAGPPCRTPFVAVTAFPRGHAETRSVSRVIAP